MNKIAYISNIWLNLYDSFFNINLEVFMTYFNFDFDHQSSIGDGDPVILRISIGFDLDRITNNRVVYGIFNWMSDVGGF